MHSIFLGWFYFDNLEENLVILLQFIVKFWFFFDSKSEPSIQMFFFSVQHKNQQVRVYSKPQIYLTLMIQLILAICDPLRVYQGESTDKTLYITYMETDDDG